MNKEENNSLALQLEEKLDRLIAIEDICTAALNSGRPMLNFEYDTLQRIRLIATCKDDEPIVTISTRKPQKLDHVILSCDASITSNPGGKVAVGCVIEYKDEPVYECYRIMKHSNTNNQGEYDAIYFGLTQLMALKNNPGCLIEVRSDSKLVIDQINERIQCNDEKLQQRKMLIQELVKTLPVQVVFNWRPRNSTPALEIANNLAQTVLGVKVH